MQSKTQTYMMVGILIAVLFTAYWSYTGARASETARAVTIELRDTQLKDLAETKMLAYALRIRSEMASFHRQYGIYPLDFETSSAYGRDEFSASYFRTNGEGRVITVSIKPPMHADASSYDGYYGYRLSGDKQQLRLCKMPVKQMWDGATYEWVFDGSCTEVP